MKTKEIWKQISGTRNYEVSNTGKVRTTNYNRTGETKEVTPYVHPGKGYVEVSLCIDGKIKRISMHKLVAEHFIDNPNKYRNVMHRDNDKSNNTVENLFWSDSRDNMKRSKPATVTK